MRTFYHWGEEYIVSFDFEANQAMSPSTVTNILHLSIDGAWGKYGDRIPAVFARQLSSSEQIIEFRAALSGKNEIPFDYSYQLNTPYHIEISQLKNNDIVTYSIQIDNLQVYSTVNTDVQVFQTAKLYLTSPWELNFGDYGTVRNLLVESCTAATNTAATTITTTTTTTTSCPNCTDISTVAAHLRAAALS